jgi:hypothetical protein
VRTTPLGPVGLQVEEVDFGAGGDQTDQEGQRGK